jgi:hypothetical protein
MTPATLDVALCIELGERPIRALMTRDDWCAVVDRALRTWDAVPSNQPSSGGG